MSAPDEDGVVPGPGLPTTDGLAAALAVLPDPVFIFKAVRDPDGTVVELQYLYLNGAAGRLYGRPIEEVLGRGLCELFPSVRELGVFDKYAGVIDSALPVLFNVPWFQESGVEGSFRLTASRFGDGVLVSASDITAQLRAEGALAADRAKLRATVDSLLDPHVLLEAVRDETGQIVDFEYVEANPAACAYNGLDYEELVGARLLDLLPGHAGAGLFDQYREVVETGEPFVRDDIVYAQELIGGQERHYDVRAVRVGDGLSYTWRDITESHLAERRLRAAYDSILDPYVVYEAIRDESGQIIDFRFVEANPAACEYNKWPRERLVGSTLAEQWPDFINDPTREAYAQVLATGEPLVLDDVAWAQERLFGGQVRHYDLRVTKITDALLSCTWRDITDRHEAAAAMQRAAAIVEDSDEAIMSGTLDGIFTSWNPAAERLYGYSSEEILGKARTLLVPEDRVDEMNDIRTKITTGQPVDHLETVRVRRDGTVVPVSLTASPIRDADGEVIGLSMIHRDITRQKEAFEISRSMIEASLDSMVSINPEGKIADANAATVKLTGVPRDALIRTSFSDYFTDPRKAEEIYQKVLAQGAVTDCPLTLLRRDGRETRTEILYNASVYRDAAGHVLGVFATARDVTKQVQAQRELAEQQARELERLAELERFQRLTVGRELKMIELKKEIEFLMKHGLGNEQDHGEDR